MPNCKFYGGLKQATKTYSLFLNLRSVPKKPVSEKFAYAFDIFSELVLARKSFTKREFNLKVTFLPPSQLSLL